MAANFFAYGTLMFPEVAERVAGICSWGEPVTLQGFSRYTVQQNRKRGLFPAIIPEANGQVQGLLFRDVTDDQLMRLDKFEDVADGSYVRASRTIQSDSGSSEAFMYICGSRLRASLNGLWNPRAFRAEELAWYVSNVVDGFVEFIRDKYPSAAQDPGS